MARRLETISGSHVRKNLYDNAGRAELIRHHLEPMTEGPERTQREYILARETLWSGDTLGAIDLFTKLRKKIHGGGRRSGPFLRYEVDSQLAMAFLRLGEEENCITRHGADSCLLPIRGGGVHVAQRGSRAAIEGFTRLLEQNPDDLRSRWLLNLAFMTLGEYPEQVPAAWRVPAQAFESDHDVGRFYDVGGQLGLAMVGRAGGCVVDDFDGDRDLDVLASSMGLSVDDQLRYYENLGDGGFCDQTERAGLTGLIGGLNLCSGDFDNDGDLDALVLRGGWYAEEPGLQPNSLLRNEGDGRFSDVTEEVGLLTFRPTQTAAVADYDNDGWLDIFIGNEAMPGWRHACELYHNDGDGTFTDVAADLGMEVFRFVKGAAWGDYDNDGLIDLYVTVSQRAESNLLFHNEGRSPSGEWTFHEVAATAGVCGPPASFATWFFDYDNDGWLDLYATRYDALIEDVVKDYVDAEDSASGGSRAKAGRPCLYHNNRDGTFTDVAGQMGLDQALMTMGCNFGDLDNDGWLDFYVGTGRPDFRTLVPNRMFRNDHGQRFQDVTTSGGFGHLQKGHGIAFVDIDGDGDQDVYAVMGGAYTADTFRNALFLNPGHGNHWIGIDLVGTASNRDGIGARIRVRAGSGGRVRDIHATVSTGGSFGAQSLTEMIGLGDARRVEQVEIRWPSSEEPQILTDLEPNHVYRVVEGAPEAERIDAPRIHISTRPDQCCASETTASIEHTPGS